MTIWNMASILTALLVGSTTTHGLESISPRTAQEYQDHLLLKVRKAYDRLDFKTDSKPALLETIATLTEGLTSPNEIVRDTTDDIVRHILTGWVHSAPETQWYRSPEMNAFFRFYESTYRRSLRQFLDIYPNSSEAKYLSQILSE